MNDDESIPVLTEVVPVTAPIAEKVFEPLPEPLPEPVVEPVVELISEPVPELVAEPPRAALDDDAWKTLEDGLAARVLERLHDRVGLILEDQVRTSMTPVLDNIIALISVELHEGLQQTIEQVVTRAVAQELALLKSRTS
jgi:hypothetical protein